jgi:hypothetical protein
MMKYFFSGLLALCVLAGCGGDSKHTWYQDLDSDGYGDINVSEVSRSKPAGFVRIAGDCDDDDVLINPDAEEIPLNNIDEDCDGFDLLALYIDADGDSYGDENASPVYDTAPYANYVTDNSDCDDSLATGFAINPDATEVNDQFDNDCDGVVNDGPFVVGDYGPAGGVVFYVNGANGLEAAPVDQDSGTGAPWGCHGTNVAGAASGDLGAGAQNTADIIAANCPEATTAAKLVTAYSLNGYSDWFLPSLNELRTLYSQRNTVGNFLPGSYTKTYYWNSTETHANYVFTKAFNTGLEQNTTKTTNLRVRAIRAF